jgi:hypothetical protein
VFALWVSNLAARIVPVAAGFETSRSLGGSNVAEELNSTTDGKIAICFFAAGCGNPMPTEWHF